jgi:hypothetical protein
MSGAVRLLEVACRDLVESLFGASFGYRHAAPLMRRASRDHHQPLSGVRKVPEPELRDKVMPGHTATVCRPAGPGKPISGTVAYPDSAARGHGGVGSAVLDRGAAKRPVAVGAELGELVSDVDEVAAVEVDVLVVDSPDVGPDGVVNVAAGSAQRSVGQKLARC